MDIDAIALGEDFVKAVETTVAKCDVLIAVIGANWLTSKNDQGDRRLDKPEDFVRMEIATALSRDIRVIPVLVDGALMPQSTELPDNLKPLVRRNALRISDTSFDGDCQRLVATIKQVLEKAATEEQEREKNRLEAERRRRLEPEQCKREEKERLQAEQPQREGTSNGKTVPPSPALTQERVPAQAEIPPIIQRQGSAMRKQFALRAPVVVVVLLLVVGVIWFAGSKVNHIAQETASVTPASTPTPTPDPFNQAWAEVDQFLRAGDWQRAVTSCITLAERYPRRDEARQKLTILLEEAQNNPTRINDENFSLLKPALERAARLGVIPAMFLLAQHLQAKDPNAALSWYEQLAARGNRSAMVLAGLLYSNHHNPEDNRKALDFFTKAAYAGDPAGKFYAGECFYDPKAGVVRDEERALKYLREAEALGEPRSMNLLGMHYRKIHRYGEARHFLEEGVRAGSTGAMANLGLMYMNGEQTTPDPKKAAELFRQAAELGDDSGMYNYGLCFFYGKGRPHDLPEANDWFRKAARAGNSAAIDYCSRNRIEYR